MIYALSSGYETTIRLPFLPKYVFRVTLSCRIQNIRNPWCFPGTPGLTDVNKNNEDNIEININLLIN